MPGGGSAAVASNGSTKTPGGGSALVAGSGSTKTPNDGRAVGPSGDYAIDHSPARAAVYHPGHYVCPRP